jgi:hypothetical protein
MKTAMQEFIDNVSPMHIIELDMIKQEIKKALEKEKEQIIDAYKNGYGVSFIDGDNRNFSRPQEYYNQTYNQNK